MHRDCKQSGIPKTNIDFWQAKLEKNVANDRLHEQQLIEMGWKPITLWECELEKDFGGVMEKLANSLIQSEERMKKTRN